MFEDDNFCEFLPLDSNYVIGNFVNNVINNAPLLIKNSGKVYRSFLYGADMSLWLWRVLADGNNTVYNVGSDQPITTIDLANIISEIGYGEKRVVIEYDIIPNNESYIPNIDKIIDDLSVEIRYDLYQSVKKMINWNKKNEKGF